MITCPSKIWVGQSTIGFPSIWISDRTHSNGNMGTVNLMLDVNLHS
jgi:hypothetical protein